jgi:hypothetical protein
MSISLCSGDLGVSVCIRADPHGFVFVCSVHASGACFTKCVFVRVLLATVGRVMQWSLRVVHTIDNIARGKRAIVGYVQKATLSM